MNRSDGTCEHYGRVPYVHRSCMKCWMNFLACPICKPTRCPDCRNMALVLEVDIPYYKAKKKSLARVVAWKERHKQLVAEKA